METTDTELSHGSWRFSDLRGFAGWNRQTAWRHQSL